MLGVRLPVRTVAARHPHFLRFVRAAFTSAWVAMACWLVVAGATTTLVRNPGDPGQQHAFGPNQPPRILLFAFYQGDGMWHLCGQVYDEAPMGLEVELSGGPLEENLYPIVQSNGTFCISTGILGAGLIYANTTDRQGLPAQETFAYVGF